MRLPKFEYLEPKSLKEASKALAIDPAGSVLLAGGTDLLVHMKHRVIQPKRVINLKAISGLSYVAEDKEGMRIGALTTLHDLASSPVVKEKHPALAQGATAVGAYAHQVMGTLGGNLCQGNRCRYYNQSVFWRSARPSCYKAGGKVCYIVPAHPHLSAGQATGGRKPKKCYSTYCGDIAPVLIALDAQIKIVGLEGEHSLPLKKLYTQNGKKPLSLKKGEILKEVLIPPPYGETIYLKWRLRDSLEFPIVSLALHIEKDGDARASLNDRMVETISNQAIKEISPMRTSIHSPAYKRKMAGILLREALEQMIKIPSSKYQIPNNTE
jgi:4-hydroxybenzoyl-CoA reductase beta subunit